MSENEMKEQDRLDDQRCLNFALHDITNHAKVNDLSFRQALRSVDLYNGDRMLNRGVILINKHLGLTN